MHAQNAAPRFSQGEIKELTNSLFVGFFDVSAEKGVLITKAGRSETEGKKSFVEVTEVDTTHIRLVIGAVGKETIATGKVVDATTTLTWKKPFIVVPNRQAFWLSDGRGYLFDGGEDLTRVRGAPLSTLLATSAPPPRASCSG